MPDELQPVGEFLDQRGIGSLANHPVNGHDGVQITLAEALAICAPLRTSVDATIETIRDLAGQDADIIPALTKHVERMGDEAQKAKPTLESQESEKK